jgi:hypothetical protein
LPTYAFQCPCGYAEDVYLDYSDELPRNCPECGKGESEGFGQDYSQNRPVGWVYGFDNARTFGQVSEYNHRRLGKELSEKMQEEASRPRKSPWSKLPGAAEPEKPETPWWRDGSVPGLKPMEKPLDLSRVKDTEHYIQTGETSP